MIAVLIFAGILGVALFVLLARFAPPLLPGRVDSRPPIPLSSLRALTVELLNAQGLSVEPAESDERCLMATRREPMGELRYVVMLAPGDPVDQATVVELAEQVKAERAAVGLLVTAGEIETAGLAGLDVPLQLLDGPRYRAAIARYLPQKLAELDRFRGFGDSQGAGEGGRSEPHPIS